MNTLTLTPEALSVIDSYLHFTVGAATCSIPYFNNKKRGARAALRARIGKGSPREIREEIELVTAKEHIDVNSLSGESLKKLLADNDLGLDCSALAYYILDAESQATKKGHLKSRLSFVYNAGFLGKLKSTLRPIENCNVATLAHDKNSHVISLVDVQPGDTITMLGGPDTNNRDHILIVHAVESIEGNPRTLHYSHIIAYPEDGLYGSSLRQGKIEIANIAGTIIDGRWIEEGKSGVDNRIFTRAQKSKTEVRRLN